MNRARVPIAGGAQRRGAHTGGSGIVDDGRAHGAPQAFSRRFLIFYVVVWGFFNGFAMFFANFSSGTGGQEDRESERWELLRSRVWGVL